MASYRYVYTSFWEDAKVQEEMTPEDKLFYLYLLTNPCTTMTGIYSITKKRMAFDLGYSIETVNSLVDRFENYHKTIKYNEETREIALLNWGKYNLNKGGKPVEDCIKRDLQGVKDKKLVSLVGERVQNEKLKSLYLACLESFDDTSHDTSHDTSTIRERYVDKTKTKTKTK